MRVVVLGPVLQGDFLTRKLPAQGIHLHLHSSLPTRTQQASATASAHVYNDSPQAEVHLSRFVPPVLHSRWRTHRGCNVDGRLRETLAASQVVRAPRLRAVDTTVLPVQRLHHCRADARRVEVACRRPRRLCCRRARSRHQHNNQAACQDRGAQHHERAATLRRLGHLDSQNSPQIWPKNILMRGSTDIYIPHLFTFFFRAFRSSCFPSEIMISGSARPPHTHSPPP